MHNSERDLFEAWVIAKTDVPATIRKGDDGDYLWPSVRAMRDAWFARASMEREDAERWREVLRVADESTANDDPPLPVKASVLMIEGIDKRIADRKEKDSDM